MILSETDVYLCHKVILSRYSLSEEKTFVQLFKPKRRGGSYYLLLPGEVMRFLKIADDDEAQLTYDEKARKVVYNFGPLEKKK